VRADLRENGINMTNSKGPRNVKDECVKGKRSSTCDNQGEGKIYGGGKKSDHL